MALRFLKYLADRQFPVTVLDPVQVAALKGLHASKCVNATFLKDAFNTELAVVHSITELGRAALTAMEDRSAD